MFTHYVCTLLEEKPELQAFVSRMGYFTAPVLFSELAREVAIAVGSLDSQTERDDEQEAIYRPLADFLGEFHLHNHYLDPQENVDKQLEHELYAICYAMPAIPDTLWGGSYIHHQCGQWLQHAAAEFDLGPIPDQALDGLAWKLELSLTISLLTAYHYYTHSRSTDLPEGFGTLGTAPLPFLRVLPDAPLGVAYGFCYGGNNAEKAADAPTARLSPRRLESFRYEALGRMHLLNLPYLLAPLGYAGPNVLAMSGTSWIPHSAKHHFAAIPGAILAPNATTEKALRASSFTFHPLYDPADNRQPVRISGSGNLERNMARAIDLLALSPKPERSYLYRQVMGRLEDRAHSTPGWADRRRVLIFTNSYQQAKICAQHIGSAYTDWNVLYLQRGDTEDPTQSDNWASVFGTRPYPRARIETFGEDEERALLFAPLLTIGRRYNILNSSRVAAFGAVIFMVRPMIPPNEQSGAIQWLNYRALELYAQPSHPVWQAPTVEAQLTALRKLMLHEWFSVSMLRHGFGPGNNQDYNDETAATMIAAIIQACGRLLRGGVPFDAYFIDAAWAPKTATGTGPDTAQTSLLVRMNQLLQEYVQTPLGQRLFAAFQEPFATMCACLTQPQSLWEDAMETEPAIEEDLDA
jgi:hypothetical protein